MIAGDNCSFCGGWVQNGSGHLCVASGSTISAFGYSCHICGYWQYPNTNHQFNCTRCGQLTCVRAGHSCTSKGSSTAKTRLERIIRRLKGVNAKTATEAGEDIAAVITLLEDLAQDL